MRAAKWNSPFYYGIEGQGWFLGSHLHALREDTNTDNTRNGAGWFLLLEPGLHCLDQEFHHDRIRPRGGRLARLVFVSLRSMRSPGVVPIELVGAEMVRIRTR